LLILFINSISIYNSAGNITLMCRRAEAMRKIGIETKFISISNNTVYQLYPDYHFDVEILNTDPNDRISSILGYIDRFRPDYVCLHGNRANMLIHKISKYCIDRKIHLMADIQGALEEIKDFSNGNIVNKLESEVRFTAAKYFMGRTLKKCDAAFVVSDELAKYCKRLSKAPYKILEISCGITETFSSTLISEWRAATRKSLNIPDNATVFCYSGVINAWGNFDKTLKIWQTFDEKYPNIFFILLAKTDEDMEIKFRKSFIKGNYIISFLAKDEYFKYLAASDVSFLIRDDKMTNYVAFPNKFSEYLNCGNLCYISDALKSPIEMLRENEIPYIEGNADIENAVKIISDRKKNIAEYYEKTRRVCENLLTYDAQFEKLDYFKDEQR